VKGKRKSSFTSGWFPFSHSFLSAASMHRKFLRPVEKKDWDTIRPRHNSASHTFYTLPYYFSSTEYYSGASYLRRFVKEACTYHQVEISVPVPFPL
jgi:hypothetical protein